MEIKDYLKYYIGCQMMYSSHHEPQDEQYTLSFDNIKEAIAFGDRPILRRLCSITEEEMRQLLILWFHPNEDIFLQTVAEIQLHTKEPQRHIKHGEGIGYTVKHKDGNNISSGTLSFTRLNAAQFHYMIQQGFWLFDDEAFETGLIIEKK